MHQGNREEYGDPGNSLIPSVLLTGRGIPLTLCIIHAAVGRRAGLDISGAYLSCSMPASSHPGNACFAWGISGQGLSQSELREGNDLVSGLSCRREPADPLCQQVCGRRPRALRRLLPQGPHPHKVPANSLLTESLPALWCSVLCITVAGQLASAVEPLLPGGIQGCWG